MGPIQERETKVQQKVIKWQRLEARHKNDSKVSNASLFEIY